MPQGVLRTHSILNSLQLLPLPPPAQFPVFSVSRPASLIAFPCIFLQSSSQSVRISPYFPSVVQPVCSHFPVFSFSRPASLFTFPCIFLQSSSQSVRISLYFPSVEQPVCSHFPVFSFSRPASLFTQTPVVIIA
jgi:hypothetical protein